MCSCLIVTKTLSASTQLLFYLPKFKVALFLYTTVGQMTMCNVKGVAYSDEPTKNHEPDL